MKRSFKTKWEDHGKQIAARVLAMALTVTTCMQGAVFPAHAESYGKNGVVRNMTSQQIVEDMGLGYNIGNTFDSIGSWITIDDPWEYQRAWNNDPVSKLFIQKVRQAGFKTIRLPVSWAKWIDGSNQIDPGYMSAVQTVVDWCMEEDMYVILNIHHDSGAADNSWVRNVVTDFDGTSAKYAAVWNQIATNFAGYGDHLIFEGMNEVEFPAAPSKSRQYELLNHLNQLFVDTVRATGGNNAARHLLIPGFNTDIKQTCDRRYHMPKDPAGRCILSIHYYSPSPFAVAEHNVDWCEPVTTWGSEEDLAAVREHFDILADHFLSKGVPVIIGEYGVLTEDNKERESIRAYVKKIPEMVIEYGMCPVLWDTSNAGDMKFIERNTGEFYDSVIRANYAELAQRKANGQIGRKDFSSFSYKEVSLPISPDGWISLDSFEPSKIMGIKFALSCSTDWDSYGGGGIWIDGYSNTPQYQFNSVFDEVTYLFSEEERARIGDRMGILLWWTDESKGGNRVKDLSFENGRVTLLYADGENVTTAGPYTGTVSKSGGGGGGGGGGGSSRPNNSTNPAGPGNQYGDKDIKDYPYSMKVYPPSNPDDPEAKSQEKCDIRITDFCPGFEVGDTIHLTMYPLSDSWSSGAICEYDGWDSIGDFDSNVREWTIKPNTEQLTFRMWIKDGTYFWFQLKAEIVAKGKKIDPIILNPDNTATPEKPVEKDFTREEIRQMLEMPELEDGQRYEVLVAAESEDGNPYECEVNMIDQNGVKLAFELSGGSEGRMAQARSSMVASGSLIGTPNSDSLIRVIVKKGRVRITNIEVKILEDFKGLSEMRTGGQVEITAGEGRIEKKISDTDPEEGLKIYYDEGSDVAELDGNLLLNQMDWGDGIAPKDWKTLKDADGSYIYIPASYYGGVDITRVFFAMWTVKNPFKVNRILQIQKTRQELDSPIVVTESTPKTMSLSEIAGLIGETKSFAGRKVKLSIETKEVESGKGTYEGEVVGVNESGEISSSVSNFILLNVKDGNEKITFTAESKNGDDGNLVAGKTDQYQITWMKIEDIGPEDDSLAEFQKAGRFVFSSNAIRNAEKETLPKGSTGKPGVKVYYEGKIEDVQGPLVANGDGWSLDIKDTNEYSRGEDSTGTYFFRETSGSVNSLILAFWSCGSPFKVKKLVMVEKETSGMESPIVVTNDASVTKSLSELLSLIGETKSFAGRKVKLSIETKEVESAKGTYGGELIFADDNGEISSSVSDFILLNVQDGNEKITFTAESKNGDDGNPVAGKTDQYQITWIQVEDMGAADDSLAEFQKAGRFVFSSDVISNAEKETLPEGGNGNPGVKVYYEGNIEDVQGPLVINYNGWDLDIKDTTQFTRGEDSTGNYFFRETSDGVNNLLLAFWECKSSFKVKKLVFVEKAEEPVGPEEPAGEYEISVTPDADGKYQVPENGDFVLAGVRFKAKVTSGGMNLKYHNGSWEASSWLNDSGNDVKENLILDENFNSATYFSFDTANVTDVSDFELLYWEAYDGTISAEDSLAAELPRDQAPAYMTYKLADTEDNSYSIGGTLSVTNGSDTKDLSYWVGFGSQISHSYDFEGEGKKADVSRIITGAIQNNQVPQIKFGVNTQTYPNASIEEIKFYYNEASEVLAISRQSASLANILQAPQKERSMFYMPVDSVPIGIRYTTNEPEEGQEIKDSLAVLRMAVPHEEDEAKEDSSVNTAAAIPAPRTASVMLEEMRTIATPSNASLSADKVNGEASLAGAVFDTAQSMASGLDEPVSGTKEPDKNLSAATPSNAQLKEKEEKENPVRATSSNAAPAKDSRSASKWKAVANHLDVSPNKEKYYEFTPAERNAIGSFIRWAEDNDSEEPPVLYFDVDELGYWVEKVILVFEEDEILDTDGFEEEEDLY